MNRLPELRNVSITIAAVIAVVLLLFFMDVGHTKAGMQAQLLAGCIVVALSAAGGAYSHRKIWPDIRPHDYDKEDIKRLLASTHRLIWILAVMFSMMWFLGNSGVV